MIAAGLASGCPAAWQWGVHALVTSGWWSDIPGLATWPPAVWFALPAAAITAVAIMAAVRSHARGLAVVLGLSALVSVWLPLVLVPLAIAVRRWPPPAQWRPTLVATLALGGAAVLTTPTCGERVPGALVPLSESARLLVSILGLGGVALLAFDALFRHDARREQLAAAAVAVAASLVVAAAPGADPASVVGAALTALWWRVSGGARQILQWQTTIAARAGALALIALVPVLAAEQVRRPSTNDRSPATAAVWDTLHSLPSPAAIVATGGRADIAAATWRAGTSGAALWLLSAAPDRVGPHLSRRPTYAWADTAYRFARRGFLVAPVLTGPGVEAGLAQLLQFTPCATLPNEWLDVAAMAVDGQITGSFPIAEPMRGVLVYFASMSALHPRPLGWPAQAAQGFDARVFDRSAATDVGALQKALEDDDLDGARLGESRFVTRVRFDRRATALEALPVHLGGPIDAAWARLYVPSDVSAARRPSICRSSVEVMALGYEGATATAAIDLTSATAIGRGWHDFEQVGNDRFRWTAGTEADVWLVVYRPEPLTLRMDAQPGAGDWSAAAVRVTLNGRDARCDAAAPPCDWVLPVEAMRPGANTLTLHSTTVAAPAPDPRRLGLLVRSITLARGGS